MKLNFQHTHPKLFAAACVALVVLFSWGIRLIHLKGDFKTLHHLYFLEDNTPLMTTLDAYFYLRIAEEYRPGGAYSRYDPRTLPLLSVTCATLSGTTGIALNKLAFYLPLLLVCFTTFIYFLWGGHLGGTPLSFWAALFGMGSYYWYSRTCLGRFDTDSLIPFFTFGISYFAFRFSTEERWRRRLPHLVLALVLAYLFQWWWDLGRYVALPLLVVPYAFSAFFWPCGRAEKRFKLLLFIIGIIFSVIILFDLNKLMPSWLGKLFGYGWPLKMLLTRSKPGASEIGSSISELSPPSWDYLVATLAGDPFLVLCSSLGLAVLLRRHYRIAAMMAVPMTLALASFLAKRLAIFLVPFYAFGLAYFATWIPRVRPLDLLSERNRALVGAGIALLLLCVNSAKAFNETIVPKVTSYQVGLAESIKRDSAPDAVVWNWWDHGYFLEYFAGRKAIIDGGTQYADLMFVAAFPLTVADPVLARNWMKLFARGGNSTLRSIERHFNDVPETILFLREALSRPEELRAILEKHGLENESYWRRTLFPATAVYLYLNHDLFEKAAWWYYFGTGADMFGAGVQPKAVFLAPGRFSLDPKKGLIAFQDRVQAVSRIHLVQFQPTPRLLGSLTFENPGGPTAIVEKELGLCYLFDGIMNDCLFTRLLLLQPHSPPPGFSLVKYVPLQGGVWRVE